MNSQQRRKALRTAEFLAKHVDGDAIDKEIEKDPQLESEVTKLVAAGKRGALRKKMLKLGLWNELENKAER